MRAQPSSFGLRHRCLAPACLCLPAFSLSGPSTQPLIPPAWIGAGKTIAIAQVPTQFGPVAFTLTQPGAAHATLTLDTHFTAAPHRLILHIPWFLRVTAAEADGKPIAVSNGTLSLSPDTRELRIQWATIPNAPGTAMSYDHAVQQYKAEYARRYAAWMHAEPMHTTTADSH